MDEGYRYLGKRDRTEAEVRGRLAAKDADEAAIDGALAALIRQGYVDDARYARTFAEDRRRLDDWGPERIERRLLALGVDRELVAAALADRDATDELDAAVALLRRRFGAAIAASESERERALGVLARKGYDLELAYDAVRAFVATGTSPAATRCQCRAGAPRSGPCTRRCVVATRAETGTMRTWTPTTSTDFRSMSSSRSAGRSRSTLRAEKRRDEAAEVAALRKPSIAAWAVNQLVRTQHDAVGRCSRRATACAARRRICSRAAATGARCAPRASASARPSTRSSRPPAGC